MLFVARERELAAIQASFDHLDVVVIAGPPGIGKSALARAVAARWTRPEPLEVIDEPLHLPDETGGRKIIVTSRETRGAPADVCFELRLRALGRAEAEQL